MFRQYLIALGVMGALMGAWLFSLFAPVVHQPHGVIYYLKAGTSKQAFLHELSGQGIITHPTWFSWYIYLHKSDQLKTGEYLFPKGASPYVIWKQVTTGTGLYYRALTIVPGWNFSQLRQKLQQTDTLKNLLQQIDPKQLMSLISGDNISPEGEFYPETYYYTRDVADLVILKRAYELMQRRLAAAWEMRARDLPYKNSYDLLIAASLIEKEAYLDAERPMIAGVIVNRLRKNMPLQIDPTVIFGMGERYQGRIHKTDLKENTPYNTYVHKGLPPTPISLPSQASLDAAALPQMHEYFYFVAKRDRSHQFSKTLPEHNAAVRSIVKQNQGASS